MTVIAKVNGQVITDQMLEKALARYLIQLEEEENPNFEPNDTNLKFLRAEVLQFLIERMLLLQLASKENIRVEITEAKERIEGLKSEFETDREWEDNLMILKSNPQDLAEELQEDLTLERLLNSHYEKEIDVSEANLKQYYNENQSRMREPDLYTFYQVLSETPDRLKLAHTVLAQNLSKTDTEKQLKRIGMNLQHFTDLPEYKIPEEVLNVLRDLPVEKLGTMILGEKSMLLLKLIKKIEGRLLRFEDIKEQLQYSILESGKKQVYSELVEQESSQATIEYVDTAPIENK